MKRSLKKLVCQNFLSLVVVPLLDANRDSVIDKAELLGLQVGRHCP